MNLKRWRFRRTVSVCHEGINALDGKSGGGGYFQSIDIKGEQAPNIGMEGACNQNLGNRTTACEAILWSD